MEMNQNPQLRSVRFDNHCSKNDSCVDNDDLKEIIDPINSIGHDPLNACHGLKGGR